MLRSFRVVNHKSFRDEAELLMLPAYDKSRPTTPVAAIFGANASGKSNLLDALRWMQTAVRESYARWEPGAGVPRTPFRLDPEAAARPSLYCVEIIIDGSRYTYGVEVDDERVREEWLYAYPRNRRRIIFERDPGGIRLGSTVPDYRARGDRLAQQTRDNALFLSVAARNDLAEVQQVYAWFRSAVTFVQHREIAEEELARRLSGDAERRSSLVELIGAADLGISDVVIDDSELRALAEARLNFEKVMREVASVDALAAEAYEREQRSRAAVESLRDRADDRGAKVGGQEAVELVAEANRTLVELSQLRSALTARRHDIDRRVTELRNLLAHGTDAMPKPRVRFRHGTSETPLTLAEQSIGTRNWIGVLSVALDSMSSGGLMIVDEVDASLHPQLRSRLINLFRDVETNPHAAQLLLTTHDATLLDEETLSRDEIWFVEKKPDSGATRLYPLTDFHPRKNEDTEGRYLAGSYGAVPVLAEYRFRRALRPGGARDAAA